MLRVSNLTARTACAFGLARRTTDALLARNNAQAMAEQEAKQRAAAWPSEVEKALVGLAHKVATHEERIAAREARLATGRGWLLWGASGPYSVGCNA
jgi:hypothetical protein